jgi:hypothetical protein
MLAAAITRPMANAALASSSGTNGSDAISRLHLLVSIHKKVIEILNVNQAEPRILHVRNSVECNC